MQFTPIFYAASVGSAPLFIYQTPAPKKNAFIIKDTTPARTAPIIHLSISRSASIFVKRESSAICALG